MMICNNCGKENEPGVKFCAFCGEPTNVVDNTIKVVTPSKESDTEASENGVDKKSNSGDDNSASETISVEDEKIAALRKYKGLLDEGIISEADFEKKKEEIMGSNNDSVLSSITKKVKQEKEKIQAKSQAQNEDPDSKTKKIYSDAIKASETKSVASYKNAIELFGTIEDWEDSALRKAELEAELPTIEKEEAEAKEKAEKIKQEKTKKVKKIIKRVGIGLALVIVAFIVISLIIDASKPDLNEEAKMSEKVIHNISYEIPDTWKSEEDTDVLQRYTMKDDDKIVGVLDVEYKGENDLEGDAAYDDSHERPDEIAEYLDGSEGIYKTVEAGTSMFEVTVYYMKDETKGADELLDTVVGSFNTDDYENPVKLKKVEVSYDGSTKAGTVIDEDNSGLTVTGTYDTGVAKGTAKPEYTVKPVTLKAGKTSIVVVTVDGKKYKVKVQCTTMSKGQYKARCKHLGYKSQLRKAKYGRYIKISGKVLQDAGEGYYRISSNGDYDDVYMVETTASLVEDDYVTVYGQTNGIYEYETVMGNNQKVPWLKAKYVER